ncbi:MAG: hypothetical protein ACXWJC_09030 [Croceibacterium sp.]
MLRADHPAHAEVMRELRLAVERGDFIDAECRFSTGEIWGGMGSVCDVSFPERDVDRRSWQLFVRLVKGFKIAGMTYQPATERASMFKEWLSNPAL